MFVTCTWSKALRQKKHKPDTRALDACVQSGFLSQFLLFQQSGPRTNPSGYPGGPVVPSSGQPKSSQGPMAPTMGYTTTGRPSSHQQTMPMSFTRALEVSEALQQVGIRPFENNSMGTHLSFDLNI